MMHQLNLWCASLTSALRRSAPLVGAAKIEPPHLPAIDPDAPESFAAWVREQVGKPVCLTFTDNRSTFLSTSERRGILHVRLHRRFRSATPREVEAIARFLKDGAPSASRVINELIARESAVAPHRMSKVASRGRFHDLGEILGDVNSRFFHGASKAQITWGHAGGRRYRRTIRLGSFVASEGLIRIHPSLDQVFVPRQYVAWVVFHEMLHEVLGIERKRGRRSVHPPEFAALEATFPGFQECKTWERDNLHRLLRYRRT